MSREILQVSQIKLQYSHSFLIMFTKNQFLICKDFNHYDLISFKTFNIFFSTSDYKNVFVLNLYFRIYDYSCIVYYFLQSSLKETYIKSLHKL